jgi:hypothetical protein
VGTVREWIEVFLGGGAWGTFMLFFSGSRWDTEIDEIKLKRRVEEILFWALMGLWFGIVATFHWRAFRVPLVFVTVAAFISACLVARFGNKRRAAK